MDESKEGIEAILKYNLLHLRGFFLCRIVGVKDTIDTNDTDKDKT